MARPVHPFKIMLDVKKPETQHSTDEKDRKLDQDIHPETYRESCKQNNNQNPKIGEENAVTLLFTLGPDGNPLVDEENKNGT
jgi:hypothetical protein